MFLFLGIIALIVGPFLWHAARGRPAALALFDGFVFTALIGLAFFAVLPHAIDNGGWWVLGLTGLGLMLPWAIERLMEHAEEPTHKLIVVLAVAGLGLHAVADGAALGLGTEAGPAAAFLALAVVLHRLPVGMAVWWLARPVFGRPLAIALIAVMTVATLAGGLAGAHHAVLLGGPVLHGFQAFMVGTLLHVLVHPIEAHDLQHITVRGRRIDVGHRAEVVGNALGLLLVLFLLAVPTIDSALTHAIDFPARFFDLSVTLAPGLLLAAVLAVAALRVSTRRRHAGLLGLWDVAAPWLFLVMILAALLPMADRITGLGLPAGLLAHYGALALVVVGLLVSVFHQGARRFIARLLPRPTHHHSHA